MREKNIQEKMQSDKNFRRIIFDIECKVPLGTSKNFHLRSSSLLSQTLYFLMIKLLFCTFPVVLQDKMLLVFLLTFNKTFNLLLSYSQNMLLYNIIIIFQPKKSKKSRLILMAKSSCCFVFPFNQK